MPANQTAQTGECPVCGASLPLRKRFTSCPACGSPLPKSFEFQRSTRDYSKREQEDLLKTMDDRLTTTGTEISDRAFNLSCGLGILLLIVWGIAVYFIGGRNWVLLLIAVVVFSLAILWLVLLVTDISRNRAMQRVFRDELKPELEEYSVFRQIEMSEIERTAHNELPEQAPLLKFLPKPIEPDEDEFEL